MPVTPPIHVSIDLDRYWRLPRDVRLRFDGWLKAEDLIDKYLVKFSLAEGYIEATVVQRDEDGQVVVVGDEIQYETRRIPVRTLPPREAFDG